MAELERVEPLEEGGVLEFWSDGRIVAKDSGGKFVKHEMNYTPPALAAEWGKAAPRNSKKTAADVDELLAAIPPEILADARRAWVIKHLAASLANHSTGTSSTARELLMQIGLSSAANMKKPEIGETCPTCGEVVGGKNGQSGDIDAPTLLELAELLQEAKRQRAMDATIIANDVR